MISDVTILNLQVAASLLMGYEYFLSRRLRIKANTYAKSVVQVYQSQLDASLQKQGRVFLTVVPAFITGLVYLVVAASLYLIVRSTLAHSAAMSLQLIGIALLLVTLILFWVASKYLIDAFVKGLVPFTIPALFRVITTFLLYSSKGAIAAFGVLVLLASFVCRYANVGVF